MNGEATVHLVNPLADVNGGSEQHTLALYRDLKERAAVRLWSPGSPDSRIAATYPVERIRPWRGAHPRGGILILVGVYYDPGRWIHLARPRRTILVYNTLQPARLRRVLRHASFFGRRRVEMVFASDLVRRSTDLSGVVHDSVIDLDRFRPAPEHPRTTGFTVGRLSRDTLEKHHPRDVDVYRRLVARGVGVRIMGGTCLESQIGHLPRIELTPAGHQGAADFLRGLDCLYYRTAPWWVEAHGRVLTESMASGLPVVCDRRGGFVEFVHHGANGFLFDTEEEALDILMSLRADLELRRRIGRAARLTAERMFGLDARREIAEWYVN
jgi:glycosyltransferase involved in cell wall biosynthesis